MPYIKHRFSDRWLQTDFLESDLWLPFNSDRSGPTGIQSLISMGAVHKVLQAFMFHAGKMPKAYISTYSSWWEFIPLFYLTYLEFEGVCINYSFQYQIIITFSKIFTVRTVDCDSFVNWTQHKGGKIQSSCL